MQNTLLLCSYNILANEYIHHLRQAGVPEPYLQAEHRIPLIVQKLRLHQWAVMCLQEVEPAMVAILGQHFPAYTVYYAQRPKGKQDGLAMLVHKDVQCCSQGILSLPSLDGKIGSRILQYLDIIWLGEPCTIVNMHVSWNAPGQLPVGIAELKKGLQYLQRCSTHSLILCGDFNAQQNEEGMEFLYSNAPQPLHNVLSSTTVTCWNAGLFMGIDHILISADLKADVIEPVKASQMEYCPNGKEGSDHLLIGATIHKKDAQTL